MVTSDLGEFSADERLIFWIIVSTWGAWLLGAVYVIAPVLGWWLAARILMERVRGGGSTVPSSAAAASLSWLWLISMTTMCFVLIAGHLNFGLGVVTMAKSLIGVAKGWALFGLFMFIGMYGRIRPEVIFRATNVLALQTLVLAPLFYIAPSVGMPETLYTSPLDMVLGGGYADFVRVGLFFREGTEGVVRWKFFAPWAPGAALVACLSIGMAFYDKSVFWRSVGIGANLIVCVMSQSRLSYVTVPLLLVAVIVAPRLRDPRVYFAAAVIGMLIIINGDAILAQIEETRSAFNSARAQSSRIRASLQSIALHRWWDEAPIFGHGTVEAGSHLTEFMAIGTHHSWNGLLFTRGIAGLLCMLVPMTATLLIVMRKANTVVAARSGLCALLVLLMYSFGDNLDILAYLCWPTFVLIGVAVASRVPARRQISATRVPVFAPAMPMPAV